MNTATTPRVRTRRRIPHLVALVAISISTLAATAWTVGSGHSPDLGLSLGGGMRFTLTPANDATLDQGQLEEASRVAAERAERLGFRDARTRVDGSQVVVEVAPGQQDVNLLSQLGRRGELRFRPVVEVESVPASMLACRPAPDDDTQAAVVMGMCDVEGKTIIGAYRLGPTDVTASALSGAKATRASNGVWTVTPVFASGGDGIGRYRTLAQECVDKTDVCPTGTLAVTLDGLVLAAPEITKADIGRESIRLVNGYNEQTAKMLAAGVGSGPMPAPMKASEPESMGATLGENALVVYALVLIGVLLLGWFVMTARFRAAGAMVLYKLLIGGALLWSALGVASSSSGLVVTPGTLIAATLVGVGWMLTSAVYLRKLGSEVDGGESLRVATVSVYEHASRVTGRIAGGIAAAGLIVWMLPLASEIDRIAIVAAAGGILAILLDTAVMYPTTALVTTSGWANDHARAAVGCHKTTHAAKDTGTEESPSLAEGAGEAQLELEAPASASPAALEQSGALGLPSASGQPEAASQAPDMPGSRRKLTRAERDRRGDTGAVV